MESFISHLYTIGLNARTITNHVKARHKSVKGRDAIYRGKKFGKGWKNISNTLKK